MTQNYLEKDVLQYCTLIDSVERSSDFVKKIIIKKSEKDLHKTSEAKFEILNIKLIISQNDLTKEITLKN